MAELREAIPDLEVNLLKGSGGVFEVAVDGELVFSKRRLGRHPQPGEVLRLIQQRGA